MPTAELLDTDQLEGFGPCVGKSGMVPRLATEQRDAQQRENGNAGVHPERSAPHGSGHEPGKEGPDVWGQYGDEGPQIDSNPVKVSRII